MFEGITASLVLATVSAMAILNLIIAAPMSWTAKGFLICFLLPCWLLPCYLIAKLEAQKFEDWKMKFRMETDRVEGEAQ